MTNRKTRTETPLSFPPLKLAQICSLPPFSQTLGVLLALIRDSNTLLGLKLIGFGATKQCDVE